MKDPVSCLAFRIMSGFCSCSYGLWFKLGKSVQTALTGAFPPQSRTQHLTYFTSPTPVSSEHWAVFSFPPQARLGCLALIIILPEQRGDSGLYVTGATPLKQLSTLFCPGFVRKTQQHLA